jgi:hypothetical protein
MSISMYYEYWYVFHGVVVLSFTRALYSALTNSTYIRCYVTLFFGAYIAKTYWARFCVGVVISLVGHIILIATGRLFFVIPN